MMPYERAISILVNQDRNLRKINGTRLIEGSREYRLTYYSGFCPMVRIDSRSVDKRNFKWFDSIDVSRCRNLEDALEKIRRSIKEGRK